MLGDAPLGGLAQVVPEMPSVCDLDNLRCTGADALGEEWRPVPAHDLDADRRARRIERAEPRCRAYQSAHSFASQIPTWTVAATPT